MAKAKTDYDLARMINDYWGANVARVETATHSGNYSWRKRKNSAGRADADYEKVWQPWSMTYATIVSDQPWINGNPPRPA